MRGVGLRRLRGHAGAGDVAAEQQRSVEHGEALPQWVTPIGQRVTLACRCDAAEEVDATYARVEAAGFPGLRAPWDAPWGQRYAFMRDPDGNRVDLFAAITTDGRD